MNKRRIRVLSAALLLAGSPHSHSVQVITITGSRISSTDVLATVDFEAFFDYADGGSAEAGQSYSQDEFVAQAMMRSPRSNDVRCNPLVGATVKETTSQSAEEERWIAAKAVAQAIANADNLAALNAMLAQNAEVVARGAPRAVFTVVYADGGSEKWIVMSKTPVLLLQEPLPDSRMSGSGVPTSCGRPRG